MKITVDHNFLQNVTRCNASWYAVGMRCLVFVLTVFFAMTAGFRTAMAQSSDQEAVGPMLSPAMLEKLDSADFEERDSTASRIVKDETISDESIYFTLTEAPTLTPEQHDRLLDIAERRRLEQPGVIGIWLDNRLGPPGIGIERVSPEAPSSKVLLRGDIILSLNGHSIEGLDPTNELRFAVAASRAGDAVVLGILRQGKRRTVKTTLADPRTLSEFRGGTLDLNRREQWAVIKSAVSRPAMTIDMVDADGNVVADFRRVFSLSTSGSASADSNVLRRRNWQIENDFKTQISRLTDLEETNLRLAEMTNSPSLKRSLIQRVRDLREELDEAAQAYEEFKLSILNDDSSESSDARRDTRRQ